MSTKPRLSGYFGGGIGLISLLHTWYASGVYDDRIRIGLPFVDTIGTSVPIIYTYVLDLCAAALIFGIAYWYLQTLPSLGTLELEDLLEQGVPMLAAGLIMVFLPQFSGASWSKATLCGLVVLTGFLVVLSYAHAIPAWRIAAIYLSLVFGGITIGSEWLAFAEEISTYRFRPMSYFVLSLIYVIGGSMWLLVGNLRADGGANPGVNQPGMQQQPTSNAFGALASPVSGIRDNSEEGKMNRLGETRHDRSGWRQSISPSETGISRTKDVSDPSTVPTVQDLLFSAHEPIRLDAPAVISLNPSTCASRDALRLLCAERHRERVGSRPQIVVIRTIGDLGELSTVEEGIVCLQLSSTDWEQIRGNADLRRSLWDRLARLASNEHNTVIINDTGVQVPDEYYLRQLQFEWRSLSSDQLSRIYRYCCGYLPASDDETSTSEETQNNDPHRSTDDSEKSNWCYTETTDSESPVYLSRYRDRMIQLLRQYGDKDAGIYRDATAEESDHESSLHILLKQFVVRYLADQESVDDSPDEIAVQVQTNAEVNGIIADILVRDEVFEIETLMLDDRTTDTIRNQLQHTFTKYQGAGINAVNVVLDPITAARYLDTLVSLCHNHVRWCQQTGIRVRFYVPDLAASTLIPVETFVTDLQELDLTK